MKRFILSFLILSTQVQAQSDSSFFSNKKAKYFLSAEAVLYTGSIIGLNQLWYADFPRSSFHFFNDNKDWLQMDKVGHFTTAYYIGKVVSDGYQWTGLNQRKSVIIGGLTGWIFQGSIEMMDGFSSQWGFSIGDITANTCGSGLLIGEELLWREQRIQPKFSFHTTQYPQYRPNILGSNLNEQILKDYNGQTYWLSANLYSFFKGSAIPSWLNLALGYGADGMTGGDRNPDIVNGKTNPVFERRRQLYLSLDLDLTKIKTKSKGLKLFFSTIGFIKIPAPTIELNQRGAVKFYPLYF